MDTVALLGVLIIAVVVLTPLADRLRIPQPVLLTIFGLLIALLPGTPDLRVHPELILPVVLPPLLFAATQRTTVREFRDNASAVFVLAVGLTVASLVAVAAVAHAAGLTWLAALVLGAMVSPPDPVAATAVARRLRLPHRMVTILEGEGMFNDATALVAFQVTVAASVTGALSLPAVGAELVLAVVLGVGVGLALGFLTEMVLARVHDAYAETTLTLLVPFLAYVGAERVTGSGVLAVLALGLFLRTYGHAATTSRGWLLGRSVWSYVDFLITSLVFALLGFELVKVIGSTTVTGSTVVLGAAVVVTLLVVRAAWVFAAAGLAGHLARRRDAAWPVGWRESAVVSWAGMRGVVTVAAALALPEVVDGGAPFPFRNQMVAVALATVLVTLVFQGLTLGPLTGRLGVGRAGDDSVEVAHLRTEAARAALEDLRGTGREGTSDPVRRAATLQYEGYLSAQEAMEHARRAEPRAPGDGVEADPPGADGSANPADALRAVLGRATDIERTLVLEARRTGRVTPASADEVLRDIEGRALRDFG